MASRDLIDKAGTGLAEAAGANSQVILFGSYARGEEKSDSDFDFLVIKPEVEDHFGESARLAKLVGELGVPADVVVASEDHVREWGGLPRLTLITASWATSTPEQSGPLILTIDEGHVHA